MAAWKWMPPTTARRRDGSAGWFRCSGISGTSVCCTRRPANCCGNTSSRYAGSIGSRTRTDLNKRRSSSRYAGSIGSRTRTDLNKRRRGPNICCCAPTAPACRWASCAARCMRSRGKLQCALNAAHCNLPLLRVQVGVLCRAMHAEQGQIAVRRIQGVLALAKKHGPAVVEEACAVALEVGVSNYRFVRRYLERSPQLPLSLRQVDPLIRELTEYRDFI